VLGNDIKQWMPILWSVFWVYEQEENNFKHVSAGEDDSTTKQEEEDVESVYSTHHRKFQKLGE